MKKKDLVPLGCLLWLGGACCAIAQGTAFMHQGHLIDDGTPAAGTYDLQFGSMMR